MIKIINVDSDIELMPSEIAFAEKILICGEDRHWRIDRDDMARLAENIPVFLVSAKSMPEEYKNTESDKPATDYLGCYTSINVNGNDIPAIYLCPERIQQCCSVSDYPYIIAKVIIHEFAHAKMACHPAAKYHPKDSFYKWMEEPFANYLTLEMFSNCVNRQIFDVIKQFMAGQPDNYRLGLDFYEHRLHGWWIWRSHKDDIQTKTKQKQDWLDYVTHNIGQIDKEILNKLFEALYR